MVKKGVCLPSLESAIGGYRMCRNTGSLSDPPRYTIPLRSALSISEALDNLPTIVTCSALGNLHATEAVRTHALSESQCLLPSKLIETCREGDRRSFICTVHTCNAVNEASGLAIEGHPSQPNPHAMVLVNSE